MSPVLLHITLGARTLELGAYSTFYTLAWILGPLVGARVASGRGLPFRRVAGVYYLALLAGIIGARALDLFVAWEFYAEEPSRILGLTFQGFSLYGGLCIATFTAVGLSRAYGLPAWRVGDSAVPGIAAGIVLMRAGCFLRGCCFGLPSDLPWAVRYPVGSPAWSQQLLDGTTGFGGLLGQVKPVHPTQLYEMIGAVLLAALALGLMRRRLPGGGAATADGVAFCTFALGFTLLRLGNHFLRARQPVITAPTWFYPAFYLVLAAVLLGFLAYRWRQGPPPPPMPARRPPTVLDS